MSLRIILLFTITVFLFKIQAQDLIFPKTGMVQLEGDVQLSWNPCLPTSQIELQIATNSSFTLPNTYVVQNTDTVLNFLSGAYYARTRCTPLSAWSTVKEFTIIDLASLGNLVLWLDASDTSMVSKDVNDNVTVWVNKVDSNVSFAQANPAKQPVWVPSLSLVNNKSAIRFDGTEVLSAGDALDMGLNSRTIFSITKANGPITSDQRIFNKARASNVPMRFSFGYTGSGSATVLFHGSSSKSILAPGSLDFTLHSVSFERTASSGFGKLFSSGVQIGNTITINPNTYNFDSPYRFLIGAYNNSADNGEIAHFNGDVPEIIMYDSFLDDSLRNTVEDYLRFKYAPPVNLGPDLALYGYCDTILNAQKDWFNSYLWSTGETTPSIQVDTSGTYSVTVTDVFGYTSSDEIEVLYSIPSISNNYFSCIEDSFNLDINLNQALTYVWNGIDTSSSFTSQVSGDYYYTIYDTLGCSFSDSFSLIIDSFSLVASLGPDTSLCAGNEIAVIEDGTNTNPYLWNTGDTTSNITIDTSGLYYFTSTNSNSCTASDSINVIVIGQSALTNFLFDTVCVGDSTHFLNLSSAVLPDVIVSNTWFIEDDTLNNLSPSYLFDSAGNYLVTLQTETNSGCFSTLSIAVPVNPKPIANFTLPYDACINTPFTFSSLSYASGIDTIMNTYWSVGDGTVDTGQTIQHQYLLDSVYEVVLTVQSSNGCTASLVDSLTVQSSALFPSTPFLIEPMNGFTGASSDISFNWLGFNSVSYLHQIALDSTFSNIVSEDLGPSSSITIGNLAPQSYFWRVGALNICGDTAYSDTSSFTIIDLTSIGNLVLWLDASDTAKVSKDLNDNVAIWVNKVDSNVSFAQSDTAKQPQWIPSVSLVNHMPAIRFDGTDVLSAGDTLDLNLSNRTIFIIAKANGPFSSDQRIFNKARASNVANRFSYGYTGSGSSTVLFHGSSSQSIFSAGSTDFALHALSFERTDTSGFGKLFSGGMQIGNTITIDPNTFNFNSTYRFLIGAYNNSSDNGEIAHLNGDIPEIIMYDSFLGDSLRNTVEDYLRFKYAPPVNLGPDISYGFCDTLSAQKDWFKSYLWSTGDTTSTIQVDTSGTYSVTVTDVFGYTSSDEVKILFNTPLVNNNYFSCIENNFSLDINLNQTLTYVWNGIDTTSSFTSQASGDYYYTIYDTLGCSFTDSFSLVIDSFSIVMSLGNDTSVCSGNSIGLVDSGNFPIQSYLWSTSDTSSTIVVGGASSTLWLETMNVNTCQARDTINTNVIGIAPTAFFSFDTLCETQDVNFSDISITTGASVNSWEWDFGNSDQSALPNPSTIYPNIGGYSVSLTIGTTDGCFDDTTIVVNVNEKPDANFSFDVICAGTDGVLTDESNSNTPNPISTWYWDFGGGQTSNIQAPAFTLNTEGNYPVSLVVSNEYGCYDSISKLVEIFPALEPDFNVNGVCIGDTAHFSDITPSFSIISRTWGFDFFGQNSSAENPSFYYPNSGVYNVSLSVTNAIGCQNEISKIVEIRELPSMGILYDNACEGAESSLFDISTSANSFITNQVWEIEGNMFQGDTISYLFDTTGDYDIVLGVMDSFNCSNDTSITLSVFEIPSVDFSFSPNYGEAPILINFLNESTNDAVDFFWNFGDGLGSSLDENPSYTYNQNGEYDIVLVGSSIQGCSDSAIQTISIFPTELDLEISNFSIQKVAMSNGSTAYNPSVLLSNVGTRAIFNADLLFSINNETQIAETWEGILDVGQSILVELNNFAVVNDESLVEYICLEAMNVNDNTELNFANNKTCLIQNGSIQSSEIYPNPGKERVQLDVVMEKEGEARVGVYDMVGRTVITAKRLFLEKGFNQISINTSSLQSGKYIVNLIYQDEVYTYPLIIQNQ